MQKLLILLSGLIVWTTTTFAKSTYFDRVTFNLGNHTEFYNGVQEDNSGGMRKFEIAPMVGIGVKMPTWWDDFSFLPEFNWVLPKNQTESNVIENLWMFRGDLGYDLVRWLRLRVGTSLMLLNQHGKGGKAKLNNGATTSNFYYPDENRSSWNNTFDLGLELLTLPPEWGIRLQTYTYSLLKSDRRQVSYSIIFTYYWDQ